MSNGYQQDCGNIGNHAQNYYQKSGDCRLQLSMTGGVAINKDAGKN